MKSLKVSRPVVYLGLIAVAVAAFLLTEEEPARKSTTKPKTVASKPGDRSAFTVEDYKATFEPVSGPVKNSFQPLVLRYGGLDAGLLTPNVVPLEFAGGEPNWALTGIAYVDGVPTALIENSSTGEGFFVKHGDQFKASTVVRITPNSVVLSGPGGIAKTLTIVTEAFGAYAAQSPAPLDVGPAANRALTGEVTVTPEANTTPTTPPQGSEGGNEN